MPAQAPRSPSGILAVSPPIFPGRRAAFAHFGVPGGDHPTPDPHSGTARNTEAILADALLKEIVDLEKALQRHLEDVQRECDVDLERVRRELAASRIAFEQVLAAEAQQTLAAARKQAEAETQAVLKEAGDFERRMAALDEAWLKRLLLRRLTAILPGDDHDHRDVQG